MPIQAVVIYIQTPIKKLLKLIRLSLNSFSLGHNIILSSNKPFKTRQDSFTLGVRFIRLIKTVL